MTTLTIQAADTASAMDEIAERLGKDALILSTTKKDGKVVMQATNGTDLPLQSPTRASSDFSHMYNVGISSSLPGKPRVSANALKNQVPKNSAATAQTHATESVQRAMMQALGLIGDRIDQLDSKLSGCLLYTSPSPRDRTRSRMPSSA